ncbi:MAG: HAD hydrolase-like protein [Pseudomonadota bacterium]|nr:HAD hydrolase-like protein [Pseudomonadota bacterium]
MAVEYLCRSTEDLIGAYDGFLLDAYGVLVDKTGALSGAAVFLERLRTAGKPYLVLTNSASRLPETLAAEFAAAGLAIPAERILTSGLLLGSYFRGQGLNRADCLVLGPRESEIYVTRAGGQVLSPSEDLDAEVVVIADQKGFDCLELMNRTLSLVLRRLDAGKTMHLLLCNPDLIYPVGPGRYGFTAGGLAAMLGAVIRERYPELSDPIVPLGKPDAPMFEAARRRIGAERLVMLGDQLATDILGANRCGIDSVLVDSGLARKADCAAEKVRPTYYIPALSY